MASAQYADKGDGVRDVEIVVETPWSYLVANRDEEAVVEVVDSVTSWTHPDAGYSDLVKKGYWDGKTHLLTSKKLQFPSGLVSDVQKALERVGYSVAVHDQRICPAHGLKVIPLYGIELRDYQTDAIETALRKRCGIIKCPPGTGKTEIMVGIVKALNVYPVLWLTDRERLLHQSQKRFETRLQCGIGCIGEGEWDVQRITIATVQSLCARLRRKEDDPKRKEAVELLQHTQVVISDETHHASNPNEWYKMLMSCPAPFRFGCSATPLDRDDGSNISLVGSIGELIYELSPEDAGELGVIELPIVTMVKYKMDPKEESRISRLKAMKYAWDSKKKRMSMVQADGWSTIYREGITQNASRNRAVLELCKRCIAEKRPTLILVWARAHGWNIYNALKEYFQTEQHHSFIYGDSITPQRQEAVKRFNDGIVKVLVASSILDEGVDIPKISAVIIAAGGQSTIKNIQRVGRGMRKAEGKTDLVVYDFVDSCHTVLQRHSNKRRKDYAGHSLAEVKTEVLT